MSYTPPLSKDELLSAVSRFKKYFFISLLLLTFLSTSMILYPDVWDKNILWSLGSFIALFSVIANKYIDIKKTANKRNQLISLANIDEPSRSKILMWLRVEKVVSLAWILGTILLVIDRWYQL